MGKCLLWSLYCKVAKISLLNFSYFGGSSYPSLALSWCVSPSIFNIILLLVSPYGIYFFKGVPFVSSWPNCMIGVATCHHSINTVSVTETFIIFSLERPMLGKKKKTQRLQWSRTEIYIQCKVVRETRSRQESMWFSETPVNKGKGSKDTDNQKKWCGMMLRFQRRV